MLLSIGAVIGGFLVTVILVSVSTVFACVICGVKQKSNPSETVPANYLAANLTLSLLSAIVGGYVCGWIAHSDPLVHAGILAGLLGVLSLTTAVATGAAPGQPTWYPWVIGVIGVSGILVGGYVRLLTNSNPAG